MRPATSAMSSFIWISSMLVYIDAFYMDKYEVTNEEYVAGLNWAWAQGNLITVTDGIVYKAGSGSSYPYCATNQHYSRIIWNGTEFGVIPGKAFHPIGTVTWYGAVAYANWCSVQEGRTPCYDLDTWTCDFGAGGYRLPTEAEWEKAARGGNYATYFRYPWGDCLISTIANYLWSGDPCSRPYDPRTTPVGFYNGELHYFKDFVWPGPQRSYQTTDGENGLGLYDMSGNVREWCNDWYATTYYSWSPYDNPKGPSSGSFRVCRGGGWDGNENDLLCAYRGCFTPDQLIIIGFRLALD